MRTNRAGFNVRCAWGRRGLAKVAPGSDVVVIVDVLSFCTTVDVAVSHGATVVPFPRRDAEASALAMRLGGVLAGTRDRAGYSLSPASVMAIPEGTVLVLPSLNGSTLALASRGVPVLAGCLRNAAAVARVARRFGPRIAVVPAGELSPDGRLRPALEDFLGAGAIIAEIDTSRSPLANAASLAFATAEHKLLRALRACSSGRELIRRGFDADVMLAAELNVSGTGPILSDGAFRTL